MRGAPGKCLEGATCFAATALKRIYSLVNSQTAQIVFARWVRAKERTQNNSKKATNNSKHDSALLLSGEVHAVEQRVDHGVAKFVVLAMRGRQFDLVEAGVCDRVFRRAAERDDHSLRQIGRPGHELHQIRQIFVLCNDHFDANYMTSANSCRAWNYRLCVQNLDYGGSILIFFLLN